MKGLEQYIEKHGKHFTEDLVKDALVLKWSPKEIEDSAQRKVYYNVTESTLGDMVYLVHYFSDRKDSGIRSMLCYIGDVRNNGTAFTEWIYLAALTGRTIDFTPYI